MTFITTANPPPQAAEPPLANEPFWPDISPAHLRAERRLDGTVTAERLAQAIEAAMWDINAELRPWQQAQELAGHQQLADVPAPAAKVSGESLKVKMYRRAVYYHVQAQLAEAYRDMDTLPTGVNKEQRVLSALEIRVDGFRQQLRWALADLQDKPRTIVELL
ncbi:head completion/stabilization protein [Acidovorax sp. HDW3]|uniref:head completion/stabilization protein n=1 Tax=Acidovorax sp. HDW3 TaxID=2714923 RepID=UPI00140E5D34|nr:head completion/stabilization protein [Acidovorax sp. HDW3]QIL44658.1 head completion/stabilization protein [Acidovorax sp. HDW3]